MNKEEATTLEPRSEEITMENAHIDVQDQVEEDDAAQAPASAKNDRLSWPAKTLRWIEFQGLRWDYAKKTQPGTTDTWFFGREEEAVGPVPFREVLEALIDGESPVHVAHETGIREGNPTWTTINYVPVWSRRWLLFLWSGCFWGFFALIGFGVVQMIEPRGLKWLIEPAYWLGLAAFVVWRRFGNGIRSALASRRSGEAVEEAAEKKEPDEPV